MKKYFCSDSLQDLIDDIYESETGLLYKDTVYQTWLDGRGWCIGFIGYARYDDYGHQLDYWDDEIYPPKGIPEDAHTKSTRGYETVEDMIEQYILHDGTRLKDAVEMDCTDWGTSAYSGGITLPMPEWPDKLVEKKKE